ncbi:hypothetical protein [Parvularcula sp. IMCC14364]|uniref:hypothetical protein n=1 Tax=Parvularcula sp. IMCC14364 TaxID=3067902 RepID=UPI0027429B28|nr:hypothetical protein [Parvularcula sp. IMCC14364]
MMFVTAEERQPLGGFLTFLLPMLVVGIGAGIAVGLPLPEMVKSLISIAAANFLYLWRASKPLGTVGVTVLVTAVMVLSFHLAGPGWLSALAWISLLALAGAMIDDPAAGLTVPPAWRAVFARLTSLPLILLMVFFLGGLFVLMLTALFQVSLSFGPSGAAGGGAETLIQSLTDEWSLFALGGGGLILASVVALVRLQRAVIGALRYAVMLACRWLLPVLSVVSLVFLVSAPGNAAYSSDTLLAVSLVFASVLLVAVNLVCADGASQGPPLWIRMSVWFAAVVILLMAVMQLTTILGFAGDGAGAELWAGYAVPVLIVAIAGFCLLAALLSGVLPGRDSWLPWLPVLNTVLVTLIGFSPLWSLIL